MSKGTLRVEASRERLKLAMMPRVRVASSTTGRSYFDQVKRLPVIGVVADALQGWWSNHPMQPVAEMVREASGAVARPLANRNPLVLVGAAAVVGAAVAWAKPWRWMFRSAMFMGFVPQIATRIVARLPLESWLSAMNATRRPSSSDVDSPSMADAEGAALS